MAEFQISVQSGIHAEIKGGNIDSFSYTPIVIDPISLSYSGFSPLCRYTLEVINVIGLTDIVLLQNGKNSRLTAMGPGSCDVRLTIFDETGNTDTDTINIIIN